MFVSLALFATFISSVYSACDNHCSGHGTCNTDDVCNCYDNWGVGLTRMSGDCSERICPFEIAWVDTPDENGNFHKYLECAGRGICNRDSGECACFEGYEGKGCQRSTCPNDCSGHGTCEYIEDLKYGATWNDYNNVGLHANAKTFAYRDWDRHKERTCVCDPLYGDFDCSKRMCPYGNDVLDARDNQDILLRKQIQTISFSVPSTEVSNLDGKTFALSFKTKLNETFTTIPIVFDSPSSNAASLADFANDIQLALLMLPNRVIDGVAVTASRTLAQNIIQVDVTFTGNSVQGPQHLLVVHDYQCGDGCTPKITGIPVETRVNNVNSNITEMTAADYNSFECGRRGKCDYNTGLCECFSGYTGDNCNTLHALF
eukprot:TRINITY_DN66601_c9_g7_i1.p1 TRINITY_DN66601_c9_g7~~TRINITY_DN66601_c9_g7_i1.p1  ORF type:complete len:373 (-),score=5.12 TRINITY_DN66601_c9_g7_i1:154-1272(-)